MWNFVCKMKRQEHKNRNCILGILTSFIRWWKWSAIYIAYDNKKLEAHRHCHLRLWLFKYWYLTRFFFLLPFFQSSHFIESEKLVNGLLLCMHYSMMKNIFILLLWREKKKPINSPLDCDAATAATAQWEYLCIHYWNKRQSSLS